MRDEGNGKYGTGLMARPPYRLGLSLWGKIRAGKKADSMGSREPRRQRNVPSWGKGHLASTRTQTAVMPAVLGAAVESVRDKQGGREARGPGPAMLSRWPPAALGAVKCFPQLVHKNLNGLLIKPGSRLLSCRRSLRKNSGKLRLTDPSKDYRADEIGD